MAVYTASQKVTTARFLLKTVKNGGSNVQNYVTVLSVSFKNNKITANIFILNFYKPNFFKFQTYKKAPLQTCKTCPLTRRPILLAK